MGSDGEWNYGTVVKDETLANTLIGPYHGRDSALQVFVQGSAVDQSRPAHWPHSTETQGGDVGERGTRCLPVSVVPLRPAFRQEVL